MSTPSRPTSRTAGYAAAEHDPIPIAVFLDHTDWFREQKGSTSRSASSTSLARADGGFVAAMEDGTHDRRREGAGRARDRPLRPAPGVVRRGARPTGVRTPASWSTFDDLAGARVAVVGGRQSAYEWAALLCDHGAASVDVVHRHDTPGFERVSWAFVEPLRRADPGTPRLVARPAGRAQQAIALEFWQVGRLDARALAGAPAGPDVVRRAPRPRYVRAWHGPATASAGARGRRPARGRPRGRGLRLPADLAAVPYLVRQSSMRTR